MDVFLRIGELINKLSKKNPFFRSLTIQDGATVYGSIMWRILHQMWRDLEQDPDHILDAVIQEIFSVGSDIDMFVPWTEEVNEEKRSCRSKKTYGWLAYNPENRAFRQLQSRMQEALQTCETLDSLDTQLRRWTRIAKDDSVPDIRTRDVLMDVLGRRIKLQIHKSPSGVPADLLDQDLAPFFTVEALMWVNGSGVRARAGLNQETILQHIRQRELHLVNPVEVSKCVRKDMILRNRLAGRLLKYKKYGFKLRLDEISAKCSFVPQLIKELMLEYIADRSRSQKKMIANGKLFTDGLPVGEVDADLLALAENARAAQLLHNDYVASIVELSSGMCRDTAALISQYAARSDEEIYHEDPAWRAEVRAARDHLAAVLADSP